MPKQPKRQRAKPTRLSGVAVVAAVPCGEVLAMRCWVVGSHAEYRFGSVGKGVHVIVHHAEGDKKTRARCLKAAKRLMRHGYRIVTVEVLANGPRVDHPAAEGQGPPA